MASRATKPVKKMATQAAAPVRKGGKPKLRAKKHSSSPTKAAKTAGKAGKSTKAEKAKPASGNAKKQAKTSATTSASAQSKRATSKAVKSKPPKRPISAKSAKTAGKLASAKEKKAKKAGAKQPSPKSVPAAAKKKASPARPAPKRAQDPTKLAKPVAEQKPAQATTAASADPRSSSAAPATAKRIQRAPAPETTAVPAPSPASPGRIVAKGVPIAPEPRSPAVEKQRMKDALAARELATKQESLYEKAVAQFNRRKFARALPLFEQAAEGPQVALSDRARVYAQICRQRTEENKIQLRNAEDYYNYGVKLLNDGELEDAAAHLNEALRRNPKAAHAHYATAVLHAQNRNNPGVYESLRKAIELDPNNRNLALHDSDLAAAKRDPAIFQLLHSNVFAPPVS